MSKNLRKKRELVFMLTFEKLFRDEPIDDIITTAVDNEIITTDNSVIAKAKDIEVKKEQLEDIIEKYAKNWAVARISKVTYAMLKVAIYEILYDDSIPTPASINEAVEIIKKFASDEDAKYANGLLGTFVRAEDK